MTKPVCVVVHGRYYHWDGDNDYHCLLAVAKNGPVADYEHQWFLMTGSEMNWRQQDAIRRMDNSIGDKADVDCVRRMAKRLGVRVRVVRP